MITRASQVVHHAFTSAVNINLKTTFAVLSCNRFKDMMKLPVFTARRYAIALLAVVVCLFISLDRVSQVLQGGGEFVVTPLFWTTLYFAHQILGRILPARRRYASSVFDVVLCPSL